VAPGAGPLTLGDFAAMSVDSLVGVGPKKLEALRTTEIETLLDLLMHYPLRYIDRTRQAAIDELVPGDEAMVLGEVLSAQARRTRNGRTLVTVTISDGSGRLSLTFFNQPWRARQLSEGTQVVVFGKIDVYRGSRQMANPVVDLVGDKTGRIVPVYPQSEKAGLHTWDLADWVAQVLRRSTQRGIADPVPAEVLARWDLVSRQTALHGIHGPESMPEASNARRRLVFDELLRVQLELVRRKRMLEAMESGIEHRVEGPMLSAFRDRLPFTLTGAQERVIGEIAADLAAPSPMHRLLQGDVGSGKTLVAVAALLMAVEGGHQGAFMAPTEVLAEQHFAGVSEILEGFVVEDRSDSLFPERELRVALLSSRVGSAQRKRILAELASGEIDIAVGTHALIQEAVEFASLGVVVVDEQHRFGVEQRAALRTKSARGATPDVLVMTATPIPRTAAMTVYGDLDVSVLDELPPGRTPIATYWARTDLDEVGVWASVREAVAVGNQAYVVCPLIEESSKLDVRSVEETYERLEADELAGLRLGLLHGRLSPAEKDQVMELFRSGRLDVLVATTVIEVGVDVPNATVMAIVDADRFGIAQLHQLRGRVGRGSAASACHLIAKALTPDAEERLAALVRTTDGFELAEVDLELRGEGTIMGERQKGRNDLRLASLRRDREWVERAREVALELTDGDPELAKLPELAAEISVVLGEAEGEFLLKG
jgi:ATP-dependent DNA helicase RecG